MARPRRTGRRHRRADPRRIGLSPGIQGGHVGPDLRPGTARGAAHGVDPDLRPPDPDLLPDRAGRYRRRPRSVAVRRRRYSRFSETAGIAADQPPAEGVRSEDRGFSEYRHARCGRGRHPFSSPQGRGADGQHSDAWGLLKGIGARLPRTPGEGVEVETLRRGGGDEYRGAQGSLRRGVPEDDRIKLKGALWNKKTTTSPPCASRPSAKRGRPGTGGTPPRSSTTRNASLRSR